VGKLRVLPDWDVFSTEARGCLSFSSLSSHQHASQMQPGKGARCEKMLMQALSNTVWAFSKLEVLDVELFGNIAREAVAKLPRFNAQNMANTVSLPQLHKNLLSYHCIPRLFCMHGTEGLGMWRPSWWTLHCVHRTCTTSPGSMALDGDCAGDKSQGRHTVKILHVLLPLECLSMCVSCALIEHL
jgi:hypothetical protein